MSPKKMSRPAVLALPPLARRREGFVTNASQCRLPQRRAIAVTLPAVTLPAESFACGGTVGNKQTGSSFLLLCSSIITPTPRSAARCIVCANTRIVGSPAL
ncbi:hypothetical protein OH77DRAFT_1159911 [Trametes cingulata]|nr:hypothetical protein OH77DRAFT_1159911 [Trametes cingulata]